MGLALTLPWRGRKRAQRLDDEIALPADDPVSAEYTLATAELEALGRLLRGRSPGPQRSLASPRELRTALQFHLEERLAAGSIEVRRSPGALHTSERWHVRLIDVDPAAVAALDELLTATRRGMTDDSLR